MEGTNEVGGVDGGFEFFSVELVSVGVDVSGFFSARVGLINVLEVFEVGVKRGSSVP